MNKVQSAKITVEVDRLKKEIKRLEAKADFNEREFEDAWRQYGSELAGPPSSIEINRNTAKELKRKANFLEKAIKGEVGLDKLATLRVNIDLIDKQIETLNNSRMAMCYERSLFMYLAGVIK